MRIIYGIGLITLAVAPEFIHFEREHYFDHAHAEATADALPPIMTVTTGSYGASVIPAASG
jgi:hypothetical protein